GRSAGEDDQHGRRLDVADDDELEQVPGRVEPEAETPREREEDDRRAEQADRKEREPREGVRALHLRQPEPDVQRRQDEEEREGVRADDEEGDDRQGEQ